MMRSFRIRVLARRILRREDGAALVEFALAFPVMLLFFALIVEMTRTLWSYQMAIEGVRDATRYVARVSPVDICLNGGMLVPSEAALLARIRDNVDGEALFPQQVTVNSVTTALDCRSGVAETFRTDPAPVATVTAQVTIDFPFGAIFRLFGDGLTSVTAQVADSARVHGQ